MEEILASIRRIIADDDASKTGQRAAEPVKPVSRPVAPPPRSSSPPPPAAPPALPEPPALRGAVEGQSSDILDLTESMTASIPKEPAAAPAPSAVPGPAPQFRKIEGHSDVGFAEAAEKADMQKAIDGLRQQFDREAAEHDADERAQLISSETSAAVDSAFNTLAQTVLVQNARTLEDLVREMLRPMLKTWLDDNLPSMVERLVRAEIERVSRGRVG